MVDPLAVLNAVVAGVLLGGFYAAVALGIAIAFGMLDIPNLAHPAFVVVGAFATWLLNSHFGIDPVLAGFLMAPLFFLLGLALYRLYHICFERRGEASLQGLAFFFGVLFITEVGLVLSAGADYRSVSAPYIGASLSFAGMVLPGRMLVPFVVSIAMIGLLHRFLARSFTGRAILAVSQDQTALRLMGVSPIRIKTLAFGLANATASIAGALLIIVEPVEPSIGRDFIGRAFAVVVLGGMGSFYGMLLASLILGITESLVSDMWNPSWAPAIAFGFLLPTLAFRSGGLLGRKL
ncbi:branched-chain amino acid transport system permease protein [Enhydrobacter aerosaccus]|uniref:Branched-chain amino acid transport system permease protein n=1 Tax=Enhydrobacter aerosaccus TaxID=225324 RepID=A0A1T4SHZ1_9HYPH|nr:branched-chain amino acid ABC transporter permease [Enhydrobacter aerosaccus]SKA27797.1 branched-chain amino acid transport system permease protein [Enhydrobacter aerosaccus]